MRSRGIMRAVALGAAMTASTAPAAAAGAPAITFYANVGFTGPSVSFTDAVADIDAGMPLLSARATGRWQICPRNDFRGGCIETDGEVANLKSAFGFFSRPSSVRPIMAAAAPAPAAAPALPMPPATVPGPASAQAAPVRPTAALYPWPAMGGAPLSACGGGAAACGVQAATAFCRAEGFEGLGYSITTTREGRSVVADVLCIRAARP